jgi:glycosyltransferase involved in cell wall biosynthesis
MRLAWFSPMPPVPTGVATCSRDVVAELGKRHAIDVYVHGGDAGAPLAAVETPECVRVYSAHDFVWRHRAEPYHLTVYQVGNSSHHDYLWPYLFRYPGLTVLHDVHVHHARAAALLRTRRADDFRREFAASHPDVSADLAELAVAGFDNQLYYWWPMSRLIIEASRLTAVHSAALAARLREQFPHARITNVRLGHGEWLSADRIATGRSRVRAAYKIADDAVLFGVFGGLTPDKRVPQILDALGAVIPYAPSAHLLLAGAPARHYDVMADVHHRGLSDRVTLTGYLPRESELTDCIAACDVSLNLRWPTAREMSGPWLRALAAARPTITIDLEHLVDVPSLDPRTWVVNPVGIRDAGSGIRGARSGIRGAGSAIQPADSLPETDRPSERSDPASLIPDPGVSLHPVTVAIDILDEDHSLRLAMRRLATDPELRTSLGHAGQRYWEREHSVTSMLDDYERVLAEAANLPVPDVALPGHLVTDGDRLLNAVLDEFGLEPVWSKL